MIEKTIDGWNKHTDGIWAPEDESFMVRLKDDEIRIDLDEQIDSDWLEAGMTIPRFVILDLIERSGDGKVVGWVREMDRAEEEKTAEEKLQEIKKIIERAEKNSTECSLGFGVHVRSEAYLLIKELVSNEGTTSR